MVWLIDIVVYIINQKVKDGIRNYHMLWRIVKLVNEVICVCRKVGKAIVINMEIYVRRHFVGLDRR